jgi:hypothetical protein
MLHHIQNSLHQEFSPTTQLRLLRSSHGFGDLITFVKRVRYHHMYSEDTFTAFYLVLKLFKSYINKNNRMPFLRRTSHTPFIGEIATLIFLMNAGDFKVTSF